jgi:hypothetical protein
MRAYVFRFAPESGRRATWSACPFGANNALIHLVATTEDLATMVIRAARLAAILLPIAREGLWLLVVVGDEAIDGGLEIDGRLSTRLGPASAGGRKVMLQQPHIVMW